MTLRRFGHSWRDIDQFLHAIGGMSAKSAHKWSCILVNRDLDEFSIDERGGKQYDSFWNCFPDLELEARQFVIQECSKKEASFTAETLAKFIDERFYQLTGTNKIDSTFVRSIASCRLYLRRFGAKYSNNKGRPYFLGHEREDVVRYRQDFVEYFFNHEDNYYTLTDDILPQWIAPKANPTILFCK
ncbi:unnamed protein product [Rotaria sp. Silwood2]|nr:unnamed protein product [Rotaria sp. Silwood2]